MQELIEKINERKIKLWIGLDGELHYRAPKGALSSGLAGEIRQNKVKIVEFLKRKVCERIVEVAERNDKIRVAEAKWGEEGLLLQVEPELIRQNYKIYNLAFLNEKMSEIWKSENADIDATVLKQWIETAERVALGEMWKVMLEHDFFVAEGQHFTVEEMESKIGVADKYKRFFRRWLKIFENENFIKEEQDGFCRTSKSWKVDVAAEWDYLWGVEKQLNYGEGLVCDYLVRNMAIMKKAYQKLLQRNDIATEIQEFEEITRKSTEHWNIISFNSDDAEVGQILVKLEISNTSAYKMTGIVAALLAIRSAQTKRKSGIWNAYETIQMQYVFEKLQEEGVFIKETQEVSAVYEESEETGIL